MNEFLLLIKFLLLMDMVGMVWPNIIMDSTTMDRTIAYRKNSCYKTSEDQQMKFLYMTSSPYNAKKRPGLSSDGNYTAPLYVNVSLDLNSLASVDAVNSEYTVILKMDLEWFEDRLVGKFMCQTNDSILVTMDPARSDRIWLPRFGVPDVKEPGAQELAGNSEVVAFKLRTDGYVFIRLRFKLKLFCLLNFKQYPFDRQKCSVKILSNMLSVDELVLRWREQMPFRNSDRLQLTGFTLMGYDLFNESVHFVDLFDNELVSQVRVVLHLQREWYHFLLEVYLPSALFVAMSWLSFWLEISCAPARVTLGMTTMLTLVTNTMSTREKLPKVAYIHSLDVWSVFCTCFVFASLIEFALVSFLYRSEKNKQQRLKTLQRDLSALSLASLASSAEPMITVSQYVDVPVKYDMEDNLTVHSLADNLRRLSAQSPATASALKHIQKYSDNRKQSFVSRMLSIKRPNELANKIDRNCRYIFPILFLVFNIIYWSMSS